MARKMKPLPVAGYVAHTPDTIALVNHNKVVEEQILRNIDKLAMTNVVDARCLALARTQLEQAFMWLNRAIFKPERIKLPGE